MNTTTKKATIRTIAATILWSTAAHAQYDPPDFPNPPALGPYYFVSDALSFVSDGITITPDQFYWGGGIPTGSIVGTGRDNFGGIRVIENLNFLATVLGDDATKAFLPVGGGLVPTEPFSFDGNSSHTINLQPFAYSTKGSAKKRPLTIGPGLRDFLNDPLKGAKFDLTLPFTDPNVALSDKSGEMRSGTSAKVWHTAVDFDFSGDVSRQFDVVAPADGVVAGNGLTSDTLAIKHTASNGTNFLTIYSHLEPESKISLRVGSEVVRGQIIGRILCIVDPNDGSAYAHLHFGVAVKGPATKIGTTPVTDEWYLIDPFGVYDYRRNNQNPTTYNYLPNNTLSAVARKVVHPSVWRTDPVIGSRPPFLTIDSPGVPEGPSGSVSVQHNARFNVTLSTCSMNTVSVNWTTFTGSAAIGVSPLPGLPVIFISTTATAGATCGSGADFLSRSGTLTFPPGTLNRTLSVPVCGDPTIEATETFFVLLTQPVNAILVPFNVGIGTIRNDDLMTGSFDVTPSDATVPVHEPLNFAFTWTVPEPLNWHALKFLQLRLRDGDGTILSVLFDEASSTFSLLNEATDEIEGGFAAGSPNRLQTPQATLHLAETTVVGSGPTGPSVTLNLSLSFKPQAASRTFVVEVAATDDLGNQDNFTQAGTLTVSEK